MSDMNLAELAQQWVNNVLIWIGFGTMAGLLAKAIMPGRDPGGAIATLLIGMAGSVIGSGTLMYFVGGPRVSPISVIGFLTATGGALILLFFYRLLAGRFFREGEYDMPKRGRRTGSTPRRRVTVLQDD